MMVIQPTEEGNQKILFYLTNTYSLFMCQDEHENEDDDETFGSLWCIFNIMGDERTSTSSLLRVRTNEPI